MQATPIRRPSSIICVNRSREGRRPLPPLTPEYLPDLVGFTRRFFRALLERMPKLAVIVLDNFQDTPENAVLATLIRDGLDELPEDVTLVVVSRGGPPSAFDEAIAHADLARLGWEDLRLDLDETRELAGLDIATGEDRARMLRERTGGWAAGLRLMLESNSDAAVPPNLVEAPETLFEYLATEVYERSPPELRDLWLATAYLPRFTAAMAGALAEREDTGERLEWLANQRYFIERRVGVPTTYQYHALFSEFLRRQMERDRDMATGRRLAHRSAALLADAGETETAFRLYCEAQDFRAAIPLILREAPSLLANGRWQTLQAALTALPEHLLDEAPWLLYWLGASQGMTNPPGARATIARAYHRFLETGDRTGQAMSASAVLDSYFAELDQLPQIDPWLEAAERAISAGVEVSASSRGAAILG